MGIEVGTMKDGSLKYYYLADSETCRLLFLPSKFLKHKSRMNLSPNTMQKLAQAIRFYRIYLDENGLSEEKVMNMTRAEQEDHFVGFLRWIRRGGHTGGATVPGNNTANKYLQTVFRYYSFLLYEELISGKIKVLIESTASFTNSIGVRSFRNTSTFYHYLPAEEPRKYSISFEEIEKILYACTNLRDRLLILLMAETGMRIGEALGIHYLTDIDIDERVVRVRFREDNENGARAKYAENRSLIISPETRDLLLMYLVKYEKLLARSQFLFVKIRGEDRGKAMTLTDANTLFRALSRKTGIHVSSKMLRRYFANTRLDSGEELIDISAELGHANISTTMEYLDVRFSRLKEAADRYYENAPKIEGLENLY